MHPLLLSNLEKSVLSHDEVELFSNIVIPPSVQAVLLRNQRSNRFLAAQSKIEKALKSYQSILELFGGFQESQGLSEEEIAEHRSLQKLKREIRAEEIRTASLRIIKVLMFFLKKCSLPKAVRLDHLIIGLKIRKIIETPSIDEESIINVVKDEKSLFTLIIYNAKKNQHWAHIGN